MKTSQTLSIVVLFLLVSFTANAQLPDRVGWWKFDDAANLVKAEIGLPLDLVGIQTAVAGPVAGNNATRLDVGNYLSMTHGLAASGGGTLVNEYTLQIDFSVPEIGVWHAFYQTETANAGDAELFTNNSSNTIGVGATGYSTQGIAAETWYRMVVSVRNGEFFKVYIDGNLWLENFTQPIDGRFALESALILFGDNDGDDGAIVCSEVGLWDVALDEVQVNQLGDATGARTRVRTKMGHWKFDDAANMVKAEVGEPLVLVGTQTSVPGPSTGNLATQLGIGSYLTMAHGIALNGEDTLVNEYSIQIDFSVPAINSWHAFYQTGSLNNSDADLFTKSDGNTIGTAQTGYSTDGIEANTWYRMIISVKNGSFFRVYMNGELWLDSPGQDIDGRFGLDDLTLLFADDDGDDGIINCSEIAIWEVALTDNEVESLGTDPSGKIPDRIGWWKFDDAADLTKAEIGSPLALTGVQVQYDGPVPGNNATFIGLESYLTMTPGIYGNGGGSFINDYSLQIDFKVPEVAVWYTFFQTTADNTDDGDLFISKATNSIGTASTGYTSATVSANTWYRMIVTVKNGVFFRIYIDGDIWLDGAGQAVDGRFSIGDALLLFGDNDGDDGAIVCSEVGFWEVALTADQVAKLGDATKSAPLAIREPKMDGNSSDLGQNYPNPFTGSTTFPYNVAKSGKVSFRILDAAGNEVQMIHAGVKSPGSYKLELSSEKLSNGIYYIQMLNNQTVSTRKMIVIQ